MFTTNCPAAVADMPEGTTFVAVDGAGTFMRSQIGQTPVAVKLEAGGQTRPLPIPEDAPRFGLPLEVTFQAGVETFLGSYAGGRPGTAQWCIVNPEGVWLRAGDFWLNTVNARLIADPPAAPWFGNELAALFVDGEPYALLSLDA